MGSLHRIGTWWRSWWQSTKRAVARWFFPITLVSDVTIARSILTDLSQMAQDAHPNEMLAFFAASKGMKRGVVHIDEIHLQAYDADEQSAHVWLSNLPMTSSIVGSVHSHPGGSLRPSDADLHMWQKTGIVHAIIGEPYRETDIRFYSKEGRRIPVRVVETRESRDNREQSSRR
jgi:proteasome lid subunit RPN8/RPN11